MQTWLGKYIVSPSIEIRTVGTFPRKFTDSVLLKRLENFLPPVYPARDPAQFSVRNLASRFRMRSSTGEIFLEPVGQGSALEKRPESRWFSAGTIRIGFWFFLPTPNGRLELPMPALIPHSSSP